MSVAKLHQFRGALTGRQAAEGIRAARRNASRLLSDAEILLEQARYPTATAIAILAIEEAGKSSVLRALVLARDGKDLKEAWRDYRSHTRKNVLGGLMDAVRSGARRLRDFRRLFEEDAEYPLLLDQLKQLGFYTDCLGEAHWSVPDDVISEDLARSIVALARALCAERDATDVEMELWIQHIGPVWKQHPERMEAALASWYAAMQEAGLAPAGGNAMEEFVLRGVSAGDGHHKEPHPE